MCISLFFKAHIYVKYNDKYKNCVTVNIQKRGSYKSVLRVRLFILQYISIGISFVRGNFTRSEGYL